LACEKHNPKGFGGYIYAWLYFGFSHFHVLKQTQAKTSKTNLFA
jgi:hypothetical protein